MSLRRTFIDHRTGGAPDCLRLAEREMAAPAGRQVLIEAVYAGVNRPDVPQRSGTYPPPPGASPYLGLEVAGTSVAVGPDATRWQAGGQGVDVILDIVGGSDINKNIRLPAVNGRLAQIAFLEGGKTEIDALPIMTKRLPFTGSTLRPRSDEDKGAIAQALTGQALPLMEQGRCLPLIRQVFPLEQAAQAHALMKSSKHIGKIMLKVKP